MEPLSKELAMRILQWTVFPLLLLSSLAATLPAQDGALMTDVLDRHVTAHDRDRELLTAAEPKIAEINERIRKFRECKTAFEAVDSHAPRFANIFGGAEVASADARAVADAMASLGVDLGGAAARVMPGQWTAGASWMHLSHMFAMMYGTGASVLDKPHEARQWTRWQMQGADEDDKPIVERAFLMATADGGEWWRLRSVSSYRGGNRPVADTIILEGLFKKMSEGTQQLMRMRGKMPGDREPNEMLVPQNMSTVNMWGMFGACPTSESVEGAAVGMESLHTPAGSFTARRVRFGTPGGRPEWWITDQVPGGWVKYRVSESDTEVNSVMELVAYGTGATSELGVR
jgi:hypothetical protein